MKRATVILLFLLIASVFSACAPKSVDSTVIAMNTICTQTVYADYEVIAGAEQILFETESEFSKYIESSEIYEINENAGHFVAVSKETYDVLKRSVQLAEITGGAFDPTVGKIVDAWDFTNEPDVPAEDEILKLIQGVGYDKIEFDEDSLSVKIAQNQTIDLGAVIKGYAGDELLNYYLEQDVPGGLLNLGGNMSAFGDKQGEPFVVGIRDPLGEASEYFCTAELTDVSLVTSGAYERFFEQDGIVYHHIIDPKTGYPASSDILSVSILSEDGMLADALSTAVFVLGSEQGLKLVETQGAQALLVLDDNTVVATDGFWERTNLQIVGDKYVKAS